MVKLEKGNCLDLMKNLPDKSIDLIYTDPPYDVGIFKEGSGGRLNFFGAHKRNIDGLWKHLKYVFVFDRQLAYDKPFREDDKVEVGMLISGWFIWDNNYEGDPTIKVIDMQKYIVNQKEK